MLDIGYASYFPPQNNGCGDVTANILSGNSDGKARVTLYSTCEHPSVNPGVYQSRPLSDLLSAETHPHDFIVTIVSNGRDAEQYAAVLKKHGGVAHVHDGVCNHVLAGLRDAGKITAAQYSAVYERWYGREAAQLIDRLENFPDSEYAERFTALGEFLYGADAIVVNNEFLKRRLAFYMPDTPVGVIRQRYYDVKYRRPKIRPVFTIRTLGFVTPNKCIPDVIRALALLARRGFEFRYEVVGGIPDALFAEYERLARQEGIADKIAFIRDCSQEQFLHLLETADLGIQLRNPTFGETSSICERFLEASVPMMVTEIGSYADLPDFVTKLPRPHDPEELASAIARMSRKRHRSATVRASLNYRKKTFVSQPQYAADYFGLAARLLART